MTATSRWTSVALVPLIAFFETASWYGSRSILALHLRDLGASIVESGSLIGIAQVVGLAATLLAGLLAIATRPWPLLAAGALLATAGVFGLAVAEPGFVSLPLYVAAFGHGLVRAALYGGAARALGDAHEHLRTGLFLLLYGATNLAGLLAPLASRPSPEGSCAPVLVLSGGLGAFALLLSVALSVVLLVSRARPEALPPAPRPRAAHLVTVFLLVVLLGPTSGALNVVYELLFDVAAPLFDEDPSALTSIMSVNPAAVVVLTLLLAGLFGLLHFTKVKLPVLLPAGVGLVVMAGGVSLVLLQEPGAPSRGLLVLAMLVLAGGEVLVTPLLLSRLAGGLPYRLETLVAALWIASSQAPALARSAVGATDAGTEGVSRLVAWSGVGGSLFWGVALAAAAFPLRRLFDAPSAPAAAPTGGPPPRPRGA